MEESAPEGTVGRRVAVQRKLAGLTQQQLANRAHISTSLVSQVEQGAVPASTAFTAAVALVLGIDVEALTGQPYGPPITDPKAEHAGIPALRAALDCDEDPDLDSLPMPVTALRTRLDECEDDRENSRYSRIITALPELLNHSYAIVGKARPGYEAETAWALLDDCYELAHRVSHQFGYFDLAALAARCGRDTAARAGDPLRAAAAAFRTNSVRRHRGDYPGAFRVIERGLALIENKRSPAADAVRANAHLYLAITHSQAGTRDRAEEHIGEARRLVAGGVPAHPFYNINVSAANVDFKWVAVSLDFSDGTTAVGRIDRVQIPPDVEPVRAGRYHIDVARAWALHGDRTKALGALNQARAVASQLTRYHPSVRETVHLLAEHDRRATDSLAGFARWAGITL